MLGILNTSKYAVLHELCTAECELYVQLSAHANTTKVINNTAHSTIVLFEGEFGHYSDGIHLHMLDRIQYTRPWPKC